MKAQERILARKNLDKRLNILRNSDTFTRPPRGWIKAIREALGMTTAQLGQRIGVSQPRALQIENAEPGGTLTIESLERAAQALNCRLVYALVPMEPLQTTVEKRAGALAATRLSHTNHTMSLEDQSLHSDDADEQLHDLAKKLAEKSGSELWEDL